jgi:serine phosphatase RsbU (regulator of sigma subunit)/anti-sigma regulatory factor (Ser/Thr protein kinase)
MTKQNDGNIVKPVRHIGRGVFSMRLMVTGVVVVLVVAAVLGVGNVAERNMRRVLTRELETRLVLEARNLANLSSSALLSDFPELALHPVIKEMRAERPDLAMILVVDHHDIIQGHDNAEKLGTPCKLHGSLEPVESGVKLRSDETLLGNASLVVVRTPILHPNGKSMGTAIVGLERHHVHALLTEARTRQAIFLVLILAAAVLLTPILISVLLRPIAVLRAGLERIGQGNLDTQLQVSSKTELGMLARSINEMSMKLKNAREELLEKERLDHEMQLARQIQRSLLPGDDTTAEDFIVSGSQTAAEEVGGDYYDVFPLNDGRVGLVIADVAGKGLGGCLVTSMIAVLIRTLCPSHSSPASLMIALQGSLIDSLQPGMFVTMFYGMLDPRSGRLTYASAGHNPLLHYRADAEQIDWHKTDGIPLGLIRGEPFEATLRDSFLELAQGDLLVQYTDGFSEAMNASGEEYGFERIEKCVMELAPQGCHTVMTGLQSSVEEWERPLAALDDKTLLVIGRSVSARTADSRRARASTMRPHELVTNLWESKTQGRNHFTIRASLEELDDIALWLRRCMHLEDLAQAQFERLEQGLYEICANIVEHGYKIDPTKWIDLWWIPGGENMDVSKASSHDAGRYGSHQRINDGHFLIRDRGAPPDADKWPVADLESNKVQHEGRGLGLRIIHQIFEDVEFHTGTDFGNITIMKFKVPQHQHTEEVL